MYRHVGHNFGEIAAKRNVTDKELNFCQFTYQARTQFGRIKTFYFLDGWSVVYVILKQLKMKYSFIKSNRKIFLIICENFSAATTKKINM
jgi:hypothetical protein